MRVRWVVETTLSANQVVGAMRLQWREHFDGQQQIGEMEDVILQPMSFRTFVITCDV